MFRQWVFNQKQDTEDLGLSWSLRNVIAIQRAIDEIKLELLQLDCSFSSLG